MYAHYDREADIAWFLFVERGKGAIDHSDDAEWGLVDRDSEGNIIGLEYWRASERLPAALLDALPEPKAEGVVVERQSA